MNPESLHYSICYTQENTQGIFTDSSEGLAQVFHESTKDIYVSYNEIFLVFAFWCDFLIKCAVTLWVLHIGRILAVCF